MQISTQDLPKHLTGKLAPIYLIAGDEPLVVQESCDGVLSAAAKAGYSERSVLQVDKAFQWQHLLQEAASMSLFSERRITDLRMSSKNFDREASDTLRTYIGAIPPDQLLLIRSDRLEPRQRQSAWFKALNQAGVIVLVWPVGIRELPKWLQGRLGQAGLRMDGEAQRFFLERIEGNLLAAVQEIQKLRLLDLPQPIALAALASALDDHSRYDTFELLDAMMSGDAVRVSRMVRGLKVEGGNLFGLLAALTSQLRRLSGGADQSRLPPYKQRLISGFRARLGEPGIVKAIAACALLDSQAKGQLRGDPWNGMEDLLISLAGCPAPLSLERQRPYLQRL